MTCWDYIWRPLLFYNILGTLLVFAGYSEDETDYFVFPLACSVYIFTNIFVQRTKKSYIGLIVYFSFFIIIVTNLSVSSPSYQYNECWSVMNMIFIIIAIAFCLEWRKIIKVFLMAKLYYILNIYYFYGSMPFMAWFCFGFEIILVCIITIALSKIVLSFIEMNIKIQHLLKTIRKLLEVFPEPVIIESLDLETKEIITKFTNDAAKKELFDEKKEQDNQSIVIYL